MKSILIRTLSGSIYILLLAGSLILNNHFFSLVLFALNLIGLIEFQQFNKEAKSKLPIFLGAGAFIIAHLSLSGIIAPKWISLTLIIPIAVIIKSLYNEKKSLILEFGFSLTSILYITLPLVLLNKINISEGAHQLPIVLASFIIIWTNDTFAYLTGMAFGRHRLFERISPKKSWEGFFGGMLIALIMAWFLHRFISALPLINWLILAGLIVISSVFGDLAESLFKRQANLKDSGKIMPGHGGILDRIDSVLFVAPVMYLYMQLIS